MLIRQSHKKFPLGVIIGVGFFAGILGFARTDLVKSNEIISAQVMLLPATGKKIGPNTWITAQNIKEFAPSQDAYPVVSEAFSSKGFKTGPMVGVTFSITAPVATFENMFKTVLQQSDKGGIECVGGGMELPLNYLPDNVRKVIQTVTFVEPPDFGPTEF